MINVTKTWFPDKNKYKSYVDKIYESGWITNNGPLVKELENRLAKYLGVKNIVLVANGTIALEIAYRLLKLEGEVITTPFTFVATTSSLVSNNLTPIFADIDPKTFNLDTKNIEGAISSKTSAIVPVHVFGNACDVEEIANIAKSNDLKVIYDAAHAFGVNYKGSSLLNYGDVSTLSFHATKLFHTIEGGALIINDDTLVEEARLLINFGIDGIDSVKSLGTNAKMNEFEAAMGLCVLDDIKEIKEKYEQVYKRYEKAFKKTFKVQLHHENTNKNYKYFSIVFETISELITIQKALNERNIFPRRYFYPSLDTLPYVKAAKPMINSRYLANRILALPIYPDLSPKDQDLIISIIEKALQ